MTQAQTGICSICSDPFWEVGAEEKKIASTLCGHVFHEVCINGWVRVHGNSNCPKCRKYLPRENPFHEIFIDKGVDPDFLGLVEENDRIQEEIVATYSNAEETVDGLLSKIELFDKQFGTLSWNDFASDFQSRVLGKLRLSGCVGVLLEVECALPLLITHHQPNILRKLVLPDIIDSDVCEIVTKLYFQKLSQLKGTATLDDVIQPHRDDLLSRLRRTSGVKTLEANQIPLTAKSLSKLVNGKDSYLLGDIISAYVDEMVNGSVCLMNDLCCLALLELVSEHVYGELQVFNANAVDRFFKLVQQGLLKRLGTGSFQFVCDTVRYYFIGTIMLGFTTNGISRMDASQLLVKEWSLAYSFLNYLMDMSSAVSKSNKPTCPWNLKLDDRIISDLFTILAVLKLKLIEGSQEWLRKFFSYFPSHNLSKIEYPIKLSQHFTPSFTLLHAAGISGSMEALLCILPEFNLSDPKFKNLIGFIAWKTIGNEETELNEREEMIYKFLKHSKSAPHLDKTFPKHVSWEIHVQLVKCMLRPMNNGLDPFEKNEDGETLLHLVSHYMNAEHFHGFVYWLWEFGASRLFPEVGGVSKMTALQIAIGRMDVKRETVELFLKAGVSLNKPDLLKKTIMYYAVKGGRGTNCISMLVELGADYKTIDENGNSGLHIAAQFANLEALRYFEQQRVDIHRKNNAGETAILWALREDSKNLNEVIEVLVELGADVNARGKNGKTVLWFAMNANKRGVLDNQIVQLLRGRGAMTWLPKPVTIGMPCKVSATSSL